MYRVSDLHSDVILYILGGRTQSRKTPIIFIHMMVCSYFKVPHLVWTQYCRGRNELFLKLKAMKEMVMEACPEWRDWDTPLLSICNGRGIVKAQELQEAMACGGTIVAADVVSQTEKMTKLIKEFVASGGRKEYCCTRDEVRPLVCSTSVD